MFQLARIKLTAWYLLIIMLISALFSFAVYQGAESELNRIVRRQQAFAERLPIVYINPNGRLSPDSRDDGLGVRFEPVTVEESRQRIINTLIMINTAIFIIAGGAGYFLAGRTLRPIKNMMDEQNRFIADASHELRTPLTALRTSIEVNLRDKDINIKEVRDLIKSNLQEVIRLQHLSNDLLTLAKGQNPQNKVNFERIQIKDVVDLAINKVGVLAEQKNIIIKSKIKDTYLHAVKDDLVSLLVILVDNAIKYSPSNSTIKLITEIKDHSVAIRIADNGVGIDPKDLPHVFDRFYRVDKSRSGIQGYGLGLAIAKKILDKHHGSVEVESIPKKGSTFTVILPKNQSPKMPQISLFNNISSLLNKFGLASNG